MLEKNLSLPFAIPSSSDIRFSNAQYRRAKSALQNILFALLPSFIQSRFVKLERPRRLHRTSFLDGLRGVAAFIVFIYHTVQLDAQWLMPAHGKGNIRSFMQLPGFRITYSGPAMVNIFFVISGYVLSAKAVKQIHDQDFEKLSDTLFSSTFRRPVRLFLPSISGIILYNFTLYIGLNDRKLGSVYKRVEQLLYTWNWDLENGSLAQFWTIPIELAGSILLFAAISGLSRARLTVRLFLLVISMVHSLCSGRWAACEFLAGFFIAEVETFLESDPTKNLHTTRLLKFKFLSKVSNHVNLLFWSIALTCSIWIAGWSDYDRPNVPGLRHLYPMIPQAFQERGEDTTLFFWFALASIIIVWSLFRIPILQRPFITEPIQYLGDISYALYIVHGAYPSLWRQRIEKMTDVMVGGRSNATNGLIAITLELAIVGAMNIWASDLFLRFIDRPSVRLARRIEEACRLRS